MAHKITFEFQVTEYEAQQGGKTLKAFDIRYPDTVPFQFVCHAAEALYHELETRRANAVNAQAGYVVGNLDDKFGPMPGDRETL